MKTDSSSATRLAATCAVFALFCLVLAPPAGSQVIKQITDSKASGLGEFAGSQQPFGALDDAGTAVYANSNTTQLGGNPEARWQIFRFDAATGVGQQLTSFPRGVSNLADTVSVSDDGQWLAFVSRSDPAGQNHDASPEVFVMRTDGTGIVQRTSDPAVNAGSVTAVTLSGSANRIVFISNSNPLGTNAANLTQLFIENFDGTGLVQLTAATTTAKWSGLGISDDGLKVVFSTTANLTGGNADRNFEIFAVDANGSNLRQLTSSTAASERPVISGGGTKIAFHSRGNLTGGNSAGNLEVFAVNWDGTALTQLTSSGSGRYSRFPSITDDGLLVYFASTQKSGPNNGDFNNEIWKIGITGTQLALITNTVSPLEVSYPVVSGGGTRIGFQAFGAAFAGGSNADGNGEIHVMTSTGTNVRQLTTTAESDSYYPDITRDGTRIIFTSEMNPFGTNPDGETDVFRMQADGSGLAQVTQLSDGEVEYPPSVSADGQTIVFVADANPTGGNADHGYELFLIHADGTGLIQLTNNTTALGPSESKIAANGSVVVFVSTAADGTEDVWRVNPNGTGLLRLTTTPSTSDVTYYVHVDDSGTWVSLHSTANLDGTSPSHTVQVFRVRTNGTGIQRVSLDTSRDSLYPDISSDGTKITYSSAQDPFGTNADHNLEVFVYNTATTLTQQLTSTTTGTIWPGFLSGDGAFAFFMASTPLDETDPDLDYDLFRVTLSSGAVVRVGGVNASKIDYPYAPRPDMTGSRVVFGTNDDPIGKNLDRSFDVWQIDMLALPRITVSAGATPTVVSWDSDAGPLRYDVVRGNVSNLAPGPSSTISLGSVACLENDSPDTDTQGFSDVTQPAPGQAFFYVYRGSQGLNFGPGSYGQSSAGQQRVPASGGCAP